MILEALIAFLLTLLYGVFKGIKGGYKPFEKIGNAITVIVLAGSVSLLIAFVYGFFYAAEAVAITNLQIFLPILVTHFLAAFIGWLIPVVSLYAAENY